MKRKQIYALIIILLLIMYIYLEKNMDTSFIQNNIVDFDETGNLEIYFLDVGQGDSSLIIDGDMVMLVDGGEKEEAEFIIGFLKKLGIEKIDYMVATHPHSDHIGSLAEIINYFPVDNIILPEITHTSKTYENLILSISENNVNAIFPDVYDTFTLDNASFTILGPEPNRHDDLNDNSIVFKLDYGNSSFMFTGDAEKAEEEDILSLNTNLGSDVLKVGHHGSNTSTSKEFLDRVNPSIAIISCGKDNSYGHPNEEIMNLLSERNINIFRTDTDGTIKVISDGEKIMVEKEK